MSSVASTSSSQSSRSGDAPVVTKRASYGKVRSSPVVGIRAPSSRPVVGIKGLRSNAKSNDFCEDRLLSGDIVEQVVSSDGLELNSPFAGGKSGLQRELRRLYTAGQTLLVIKVKRGGGKVATIKASIVPDDSTMLRKQYVLKASNEPSHVVMFTDSTEEECLALQEMRCARMVSHLVKTQLTDVNIPYSWEGKMKQVQPVRSSSMVFSMMVVPHARECASMPQYNNLENTVAQAMVWLSASQASGVPINFLSIQTEPLLTKVSGQKSASRTVSSDSKGDLSSIVNTSIYGFEDYHGIDIGIVRAVRVWYVPNFAEVAVELKVEEDETRLGVGISRTEEGFCYVSNVELGTAADRAGLRDLLTAAQASRKLLVVTRVADEKATPWLVSSNGSIRCFDTGSISGKLSAQRQAGQPARLHVMALEDTMHTMVYQKSEPRAILSSKSERGFSDFFDQGHFQRE